MTPRVEPETFMPGERVREKRTLPPRRGGVGTVLAVSFFKEGVWVTIRWDGGAIGQRPAARLEHVPADEADGGS